jgi:hypothetical protein
MRRDYVSLEAGLLKGGLSWLSARMRQGNRVAQLFVGGTDDDVCGGDLDLDPGISALELHASRGHLRMYHSILRP